MGTAALAQGWPSSALNEVADRPARAACTRLRALLTASLSLSVPAAARTLPAGSMMATSSPVRDWYWARMAVRSAMRPCSTSSLATAARPLAWACHLGCRSGPVRGGRPAPPGGSPTPPGSARPDPGRTGPAGESWGARRSASAGSRRPAPPLAAAAAQGGVAEAKPDPAYRLDPLRAPSLRRREATWTSTVLVGPVPVGVPHLFEDGLAAHHRAGIFGQQGQQVELLGGQGHLAALDQHSPGPPVDGQGAQDLRSGRWRPARSCGASPPGSGRPVPGTRTV